MANQFHAAGVFADYTPSGSDVTAGDIIDGIGIGVGVADNDIPDGTKGALRVAGVYLVDNPDDTAFAQGADVQWDATNKKAVVTGDFAIGTAYYAYVTGTLRVAVAINSQVA